MKKSLYLLSGIIIALSSLSFLAPSTGNEFINKLKQHLNNYNHYLPQEKVYLHFDKTFYKPGDIIWFKAYLRKGIDHKASPISEILNVELINPKGNVEKAIRLIAREGAAQGDFLLDTSMPGGMYKVKAYTNWMKNDGEDNFYQKDIQVQTVLLPRLLMNLEFERKAYGPGDQVIAKLNLSTLANEPLTKHKFNFIAQLDGTAFNKGKNKTDDAGTAHIRVKLPEKLKSNDGLLNVTISHNGSNESISRSIPIVLNNIDLQFFPEGGDLIQNVSSKVAFKALNEFGKPADIEGIVLNENGDKITAFKSYHQGMGAFKLFAEGNEKYQVRITQPEGIKKTYQLPRALPKGFRLSITNQQKRTVQANIHAPFNTNITLIGQTGGEIYYAKEIKVKEGENLVEVPTEHFPAGIAQLTIFDRKEIARCERLIFVNAHKQLNIEVSTNKEKYLPREKVEMTINVTDEDGLPVPTQLSLSVVDDKLISFADDKQANILAHLLLNSDLKGKIEDPNFYFDKNESKAQKALDYLLMTHGWRRFEWQEILHSNEMSLQKQILHAAEKAIVKGRVIKFKDDQPVANAKVTVLETEEYTYTDDEGKFEFKNLDLSLPRTLQVTDAEGKERIIQINDYAQEYLIGSSVKGKVTDAYGNAILGAVVSIKGTTMRTVTDDTGHFELDIPEVGSTLIFSFVGYTTQEVNISGKNVVDVEMEEDVLMLEEALMGSVPGINVKSPVKPEQLALVEKAEVAVADEVVDADLDIALVEVVLMDEEVLEERMEIVPEFEEEAENIFVMVEEMPEPYGGYEKLYEMIAKNIVYPEKAVRMGIEGRTFIQFIVQEDGSLTDIEAIKGPGAGCDEEAERVIASLPKWKPGKQRGTAVKTRMIIPIHYNLEDYQQTQSGLMFKVASNSSYNLRALKPKYYSAREFYKPAYNPGEKVETRTDFRKTIYWNPDIKIDKTGSTTLSFYNSDEITTFRATIEGIAQEGLIGRCEYTYFTQLPFSMDTKVPAVLAFEDKTSIPVTLTNNTNKPITGQLEIEVPENFQSLKNNGQTVTIAAKSVKTLFFDYLVLPKTAGVSSFKVTFESNGLRDSFEYPIEIKSKGFPAMASFSGNESAGNFRLEVRDLVQHSLKAKLTAYPDVLTDLMAGIESILREPYGCFEQTSSSTYPNILALQYMEESGTIAPQIREKALALIDKGYKRLISFETSDLGYEWFGSTPPHEGLTAYGLMEFNDMQQIYASVDNKMVQRTTNWILNRRDGAGGFKRSGQALDQFGRASEEVSNAYVVYALSEIGHKDLQKELDKSYHTAVTSGDAYQLALVSNAMFNMGDSKDAEKILDNIIDIINNGGIKALKADHSITRSTGKSLQVETVSLIAMALLKSPDKDVKAIRNVVDFLVQSRGNYGGFGSTQATILALKALTDYARFAKRSASSGTIEILVDGKKVASKFYKKGTKEEIVIDHLEKYLKEGTQAITVNFKDTNEPLPYSFDISWNTYTPVNSKECKVDLQTNLSNGSVSLGETVRLSTILKNKTDQGLPMTVALIGIPSGLSPQPWQLKELLDKKKIDFYEINKNYVILYYRQLAPHVEHEINLDLKTEIAGNYEAPASSAYLYYTNEHKTWTGGERIIVKNPKL